MKTKLVDGLWITTINGTNIITSDVEYAISVAKAIELIKNTRG